MTLNGVMALILRYFTELGNSRGALCKSGWRCRRFSVRYLISWWVSRVLVVTAVSLARPHLGRPYGTRRLTFYGHIALPKPKRVITDPSRTAWIHCRLWAPSSHVTSNGQVRSRTHWTGNRLSSSSEQTSVEYSWGTAIYVRWTSYALIMTCRPY